MAAAPESIRVCKPDWSTLRGVVDAANDSLLLCSPYISTEGVNQFFDTLVKQLKIVIVTRLSPSDWANGISDPEALLVLLETLTEGEWPVNLWIHQRLHAKVYIADSSQCLLGSANLSTGGFDRNFELAVYGGETMAEEASRLISEQLNGRISKNLAVCDLATWVHDSKGVVRSASKHEIESNDLAEVQRQLDRMLGQGGGRPRRRLNQVALGDFVAWLQERVEVRGSAVLIDRYENQTGQNLTGHVKQTHAASQLFFENYPNMVAQCAGVLQDQTAGDVPVLPDDIVAQWNTFVDTNADFSDDECDFAILRGYLPPSLGGTRTGGGGGSSTLKRIMPLVAMYRAEQGMQ